MNLAVWDTLCIAVNQCVGMVLDFIHEGAFKAVHTDMKLSAGKPER